MSGLSDWVNSPEAQIVRSQMARLEARGLKPRYVVMGRPAYEAFDGLSHESGHHHLLEFLYGLQVVLVEGPAEMLTVVPTAGLQYLYGERGLLAGADFAE